MTERARRTHTPRRPAPSLTLALIAAFAAALVAGCGGREEAAPGPPAPAAGSAAEAPSTATAAEAAQQPSPELRRYVARQRKARAHAEATREAGPPSDGSPIELPEAFPKDVPIPPDAVPTRYAVASDSGTLTELDSTDSTQATRSYYKAGLANEGWEVLGESQIDDITMLTAVKDGRQMAIAIRDADGKTRITLIESAL